MLNHRSSPRVDYYTVSIRSLSDNSLLSGVKFTTRVSAEAAYLAACTDSAGTRVELGVKRATAWLKPLKQFTSDICPECGKARPSDMRVAMGMKCVYCTY